MLEHRTIKLNLQERNSFSNQHEEMFGMALEPGKTALLYSKLQLFRIN